MRRKEWKEESRTDSVEVGEWYGSSGANQSKIKCIYIFRWVLRVSLSNYFISIFHLHAVQSKSISPWGKFPSLPPHRYFYRTHTCPSPTLLTSQLPFIMWVITIHFLSICTCSPYLRLLPAPAVSHHVLCIRGYCHMCPKMCVCACVQRFIANALSTAMFYGFCCPGKDNLCMLM